MKEKELPKAYEPKKYEDTIYKRWEESGFFSPDTCEKEGKTTTGEKFSMVLPPPNVTGTLHMGHAVMLAVQDVMARYHRMKGDRTLWVPGVDHASIATSTKVENILYKTEKKTRHDIGREEFLKRVEKFAQDSHDTIVDQCKKMGASLDWSREAYTLDEPRNRAVNFAFKKMYEDGLIYRGHRVVNWDPIGQTTISDIEIVYKEVEATLYTFKYSKDFPIAISTTRPETKVGDTAVAVHPDDKRYKKFIGKVFKNIEFAGAKINITIVGDESVDPNFGTGALGVTPAHSLIDADIAQRHKLEMVQVIGEDGRMLSAAGPLVDGQTTVEARNTVVEWLHSKKLIEHEEKTIQNLATAERSGGVVEPIPMLQWFITVTKEFDRDGKKVTLKSLMQKAVRSGDVKIIPERFEKTYFQWVDNLRDWNISRQIWFGHRIPVWYKSEEIMVGAEPAGQGWKQDPDTLDTWFSAGMWTFSTLGWPQTTVGFVRHGEAENNVAKTVSDDISGSKLTEKGRKQVIKLVEKIKKEGFEIIVASPVLRAKQTGEILAEKLGLSIEFDERIREVGFGKLDHHTEAEIEKERNAKGWMVMTPFGMESYVSLRKRTHEFMQELIVKYPGKRILVVSHGDTLGVLKQFGTDLYTNDVSPTQEKATCDTRTFANDGKQSNDLETFHPTSVLETGYDILFPWVSRMILMSAYHLGKVPFKNVYLHGLVRDEQGRKMSKSLDNIINPLDMIEKYGTDATRLSLLIGGTPGNDMKLSEEKIAGFRNFTNKLWNISRFMIGKIQETSYKIQKDIKEPKPKTVADEWILSKLNNIVISTTKSIEQYQFSAAGELLRDFTWGDLADWYLEIAKIESVSAKASPDKGNKDEILNHILNTILKLWHPYMPFVTEAIWKEIYGEEAMLMVEKYPKAGKENKASEKIVFIEGTLRNVITKIRAIRTEYRIEPGKKLVGGMMSKNNNGLIKEYAPVFMRLTGLESISSDKKPAGAISFTESGVEVWIDLRSAVDTKKETARIEKEIASVEPYVKQLEKKLSNKEFVKNAPHAVVEKEQQKLEEGKQKLEALKKQLNQL